MAEPYIVGATRAQRAVDFLGKLAGLDIFPLFLGYLALVSFGPVIWKKIGKPLELRSVLVLYNLTCAMLSLYSGVGMTLALLQTTDVYSHSEFPPLTYYYKVYALTKLLELMDTVFMILRNRGRQITFLHVFHHSTMLILIHYALRFSPWTALGSCLALNSYVHVILYFYYGYTAMYPQQRPVWKRRLTEIQIIQFIIDLVYCTKGVMSHNFCLWSFVYGVSMVTLFSNFYIKAYLVVNERQKGATHSVKKEQ